jgi:hypothetical protein
MNQSIEKRALRMVRECRVSAAPAVLLAAVGAALAAVGALGSLLS